MKLGLTAAHARKTVSTVQAKLIKEHQDEYEAIEAKRRKVAQDVWDRRGNLLITKIEGYIRKAAAKGERYTWEPTTTNPNGDQIIYLGEGDLPIHELLMAYFRRNGFTVEEYQYGGIAKHIQSVPVHESRNGRTIWNGAVQIYDLTDSPSGATRAATSHPIALPTSPASSSSRAPPEARRRSTATRQAG